jgi:hypothetical protein
MSLCRDRISDYEGKIEQTKKEKCEKEQKQREELLLAMFDRIGKLEQLSVEILESISNSKKKR